MVVAGGHLSTEELLRLATGGCRGPEREAALSHLEICEPCGDRLATILVLRVEERATRRRARVWAAGVAAAIALTAMLYTFAPFLGSRPDAGQPPPRAQPADRWAAFASRENFPDLIYEKVFLEDIYTDVIPVSPDHPRPRMRAAVIDMRNGRYDAAVIKLVRLHFDYPDFDNIAGWLGMALYLSGESGPEVAELLERGTQAGIGTLRELCGWYAAQHFLVSGRPEDAILKLRELSQRNDHVGRQSAAQLQQLPLDGPDGEGPRRDPRT